MNDSSESGLDVFDDLIRRPQSKAHGGASALSSKPNSQVQERSKHAAVEGEAMQQADDSSAEAPARPSQLTFASESKSGVVAQSSSDRGPEKGSSKDAIPAPATDWDYATQAAPDGGTGEQSEPTGDPLQGILKTSGRVVPPAAFSPSSRLPPAFGRAASAPDDAIELIAKPEPTAKVTAPPPPSALRATPTRRPLPPSSVGFGAGRSTPLPASAVASRSDATAPGRVSGKGVWMAVAAIALVAAIAVAASVATKPSTGALIVSASGPNGRALPSVATLVDGVKRCDVSPCRIEGLSDGVHIVEARAPGHVAIAGKAVKVDGGDEVPFDVELQQSANSAPAARQLPEAKPAGPGNSGARAEAQQSTPTANLEEQKSPADAVARQHQGPPSAQAVPPAEATAASHEPSVTSPPEQGRAAQATLNFNSVPASNVVLDGRPLGRTPQMGISVAPGGHSVLFIHATYGRKSHQISIDAGQAKTAVVRFP